MNPILATLFRHVLRSLLRLRVLWLRTLKRGPHGEAPHHLSPTELTALRDKDDRFRRLLATRTPQVTESSCSAAAVACVLNAMGTGERPRVENQMDLLETIRAGRWKERLSPEGWKGRRGLPLEVLGEVVPAALAHHGIHALTEVVPFYPEETLETRMARAGTLLDRFANDPDLYLIVHFDQGAFLPVLTIPHISPVGRWNPETQTVLMLDVDPDQPTPYEVSLARFADGIASNYGGLLKPYGYNHGGLVVITAEKK